MRNSQLVTTKSCRWWRVLTKRKEKKNTWRVWLSPWENYTMLARAVRSSCARLSQRPQGPFRNVVRIGHHKPSVQCQLRVLTTSRSLRSNQKLTQTPDRQPKTHVPASQPVKQSDAPAAETKSGQKKDILSQGTATNKEQRKADWAIMKEMVKYLWPKVRDCYVTSFDRELFWLSTNRIGRLGH